MHVLQLPLLMWGWCYFFAISNWNPFSETYWWLMCWWHIPVTLPVITRSDTLLYMNVEKIKCYLNVTPQINTDRWIVKRFMAIDNQLTLYTSTYSYYSKLCLYTTHTVLKMYGCNSQEIISSYYGKSLFELKTTDKRPSWNVDTTSK